MFQTWSSLFQFAENIQYRQISLELISSGPHSSLERERPFRGRLFVYSIKREIRHFYVVVVQQWQRNVQKSMMHVQTCCFFLINLLLFWHSRCQCSQCFFQRKTVEQIEPKETPSCLIPLLLVVLIQQLQILVTTLVNYLLIVNIWLLKPWVPEKKFLMLLCCEVKAI